jgi:hypothetical protein
MPYTPPSGIGWGTEVYRATFFPIRSDGGIDAPDYPVAAETPYEGLEFVGPKSLALNLGAPRTVVNISQGAVQDTIYLPSIDAKTAEFHVSYIDLETFATLGSVLTRTVGGGKGMPMGTDKQGLEISGTFMISQLAWHNEDGVEAWHNYLIPRAKAIVQWPSFNDAAIDVTIALSLSSSRKHVWGQTLTENTDGATKMHAWDHQTFERFNIVAWLADGSEDVFLFPADKQPLEENIADTLTLWDYAAGTQISSGFTPAAANVDFVSPPAADKLIIALYEY